MVLLHETTFKQSKDTIELISTLLIAAQKFFLYVGIVRLIFLQQLPISVEARYF